MFDQSWYPSTLNDSPVLLPILLYGLENVAATIYALWSRWVKLKHT